MRIKGFFALLLVFCILLPALAQTTTPPKPQKPSDDEDVVRITTNLVQVDAVVTKDGKPVTNLTADDFEIYQDGKKQTITSFAYISNVTATTPQPARPVREKGREVVPVPPVQPNDPHRTIAFVVDDLGTSGESMGHVRRQLRKFVTEELQPNDLVAIIRTGGWVGALQQFTNDPRVLNRAVDQLRWNHCSRVGISMFRINDTACAYYSVENTVRALRFILDAMGELPGRKSMVLMGDSLPLETQEAFLVPDAPLQRGSLSGDTDSGGKSPTDAAFSSLSNTALLRRVAEKAIRSSVVIYSVDTQGLATTGPFAEDTLGTGPFQGNPRNFTEQLNARLAFRSRLIWARQGGGDLLARQTGGFQIRNSNNFQINRIVEDQSGYYLIGYRPTEETFNRRFHRIKAKVKPSGMTVRTRFGFVGVSEEDAKKERSVVDLTNLALASPFAAQDINVNMSSFFANDKTTGSLVRSFVYIDAKDVQFTAKDNQQHASLVLQGVLFGDNGMVAEQVTRTATLRLSQSNYDYAVENGMQLSFDIPVKRAGAYQVRIAARDANSSRIGSAGQFVDVPDLNKKTVAVSGIVLGTARDNAAGLANPGARRFVPKSEVHFAYMLYNAVNKKGGALNLVMQAKLFHDGKNVYSAPEVPISTLDKADPARVIITGSVGLAENLEPGVYYLQVVVKEADPKSKSAPVIQWMEFEVVKSE